jgi:hypothetical protein
MQIGNIDVFFASITIASACNEVLMGWKQSTAATDATTGCPNNATSVTMIIVQRPMSSTISVNVSDTGTPVSRSGTKSPRAAIHKLPGMNGLYRDYST